MSVTSRSERAIYRVMMSPMPPSVHHDPPSEKAGWLASGLGLDVYGDALLSRRGVLEMRFIAILLVIIMLFELGAWTLLFNAIFHSELLEFGWASFLALIPASLFAGAVLIYERQFVATDLSASLFRLVLPVVIRLMVIAASAVITAQPIELLIFRGQILDRVHKEGVRLEVVTRIEQYQKAEEAAQRYLTESRAIETGDFKLREDTLLQEVAAKRQEQRDRVTELTGALERAQRNVNYFSRILREQRDEMSAVRRRDASKEEIAVLEATIAKTSRNLNAWAANRDKAQDDLNLAQQRVTDYSADLQEARKEYATRREQALRRRDEGSSRAERSQERLVEWINQLRNADPDPDETIVEKQSEVTPTDANPIPIDSNAQTTEAQKPFRYTMPKYGFFEQLRVLRDLRYGYPPQWEGVSEERAEELGKLYSLVDVRPCSDQVIVGGPRASTVQDCDRARWERHKAQAEQFNWSFRVVFFIALVIPLLVIASKLLMTSELKAYYSSASQAASGNSAALAHQRSYATRRSGNGIMQTMMGSAENEGD